MSVNYKEQCLKLQNAVTCLNQDLVKKNKTERNNKKSLSLMFKELNLKDNHIKNLLNTVNKLNEEIDDLRDNIRIKEEVIEENNKKIDDNNKKINELSEMNVLKDEAISELQKNLSALSSRKVVKITDSIAGIFRKGEKKKHE